MDGTRMKMKKCVWLLVVTGIVGCGDSGPATVNEPDSSTGVPVMDMGGVVVTPGDQGTVISPTDMNAMLSSQRAVRFCSFCSRTLSRAAIAERVSSCC